MKRTSLLVSPPLSLENPSLILFHQGITLSCAVLLSVFNPCQSPDVQRGPPDSPFAGGEFHGVLLFPSEYPFKPPGIKVAYSYSSLCGRFRPEFPADVHTNRPFSAR